MESLEKAAWSSRPRFAVEMAFIQAVQADDVVPVTELLGRLDSVLAGVVLPQASETIAVESKKKIVSPASPEEHAVPEAPPSPPLPEAAPHPAESFRPVPPAPQESAPGKRDIRKDWQDFIASVKKRHQWMAAALKDADSVQLENGRLILTYHNPAQSAVLKGREKMAELTALAIDFFQENLDISFSGPDTCAWAADTSAVEIQQERKALEHDSLVQMAAEIFNGQVVAVRVGPQYRKPLPVAEDEAASSDEM